MFSAYPPVAPGSINLAQLLAGSEGTLAVMRRLTVRLSPVPQHTLLAIYPFPSLAEACDAAPLALEHAPSAVELIPGVLIQLARSVPAYAAQLTLLNDLGAPGEEPPAILAVEFSVPEAAALKPRAEQLQAALSHSRGGPARMLLAESKAAQAQVWTVRKVGLGLIMSRPSDVRPYSFIEDLAVPVERLGEFVRGMERILAEHGVQGENYGHASAGCLHIRPMINLKTVTGVHQLRSIATAAVELALGLGGSVSGEHGDGYARSEWYGRMFGPQIMDAFRELKAAADPHELLNPGKMISLGERPIPPMDENLRFGAGYQARAWTSVFAFNTVQLPSPTQLATAIEQCNGAGVCRKAEGVMCPSFQATQEEMHSTRGRSNLLRALISGRFPSQAQGEAAAFEALDLCLACKGCKAECPSGVDVARLKYTFMDHYYSANGGAHRRKLRDYLFGYIGPIASLTHWFAPLVNPFLRSAWFTRLFERLLGVSAKRRFPAFAWASLSMQARRQAAGWEAQAKARDAGPDSLRSSIRVDSEANRETEIAGESPEAGCGVDDSLRETIRIDKAAQPEAEDKIESSLYKTGLGGCPCGNPFNPFYTLSRAMAGGEAGPDRVLFLSDPFTEYMTPQIGLAALEALRLAGCQVVRLPVIGAGRTLISKGFLKAAQKQARKVLQAISYADPQLTLPVVGVEPSEIHALLDEYLELLPGDPDVQALAKRSWTVEEFLLRPGPDGRPRILRMMEALTYASQPSPADSTRRGAATLRPYNEPDDHVVLLHGHCYQKARPPADDGLPVGVKASAAVMETCGYTVRIVDDGCCGMAGAFGYESDHYDVSMKVGDLALFPAIRAAEAGAQVAAAGVSCREQILDGTRRQAQHPIELVLDAVHTTRAFAG